MQFFSTLTKGKLIFPGGVLDALDAAWDARIDAFLVEGEPGTGKTDTARLLGAWAEQSGGHFIFAQANSWMSDEQTIRGVNLAGFVERDASRVYAAGVLLRAAELGADGRPTVVLLDEWDKTRPVADGLLLAALEERLVVDSTGHVHGRFGSNVIFWITSNASRPLADALVRRCLRVVLPRMAAPQAIALLQERTNCGEHLATALVAMRDRAQTTVTLPDMIRLSRTLQHVGSVDACRVLAESLLRNDPRSKGFDPGADLWAALRRDVADGWTATTSMHVAVAAALRREVRR